MQKNHLKKGNDLVTELLHQNAFLITFVFFSDKQYNV